MHSFRHAVASRAPLAGESMDEVAFLLGPHDATVTCVIYIHEIADARRRHMRRSRMTAEYAGARRVALESQADDRSVWRAHLRRSGRPAPPLPSRAGALFYEASKWLPQAGPWTASQALIGQKPPE